MDGVDPDSTTVAAGSIGTVRSGQLMQLAAVEGQEEDNEEKGMGEGWAY